MDQSHSESDVSLSPSQILDRIQMLKQLQILQRGKLHQQLLQYQNSPEITSSITEIVSHFSDSASYNAFKSLLHSSENIPNGVSPPTNLINLSKKENLLNMIDGISVLNISTESEVKPKSPVSTLGSHATQITNEMFQSNEHTIFNKNPIKQISLDDMPILSPKQNFEALVTEKLKSNVEENIHIAKNKKKVKKPFLKRGEGTARFGIRSRDFVIQNTKSLPWRKKATKVNTKAKYSEEPCKINSGEPNDKLEKSNEPTINKTNEIIQTDLNLHLLKDLQLESHKIIKPVLSNSNKIKETESTNIVPKMNDQKREGKTWAAVLTKEQDEFLKKLKQSDYYKNFTSPAKSNLSDISYSENIYKQEKEIAEQNMFDLLENKVCHESFNIQNSFFNKFLRVNKLECSGESTPLVMQKYLSKNPNLLHIFPEVEQRIQKDCSCSDTETCNSECLECSENCSTFSNCSCKTVTQSKINDSSINNDQNQKKGFNEELKFPQKTMQQNEQKREYCDNVTVENEIINNNMVEMNSKLITTSELLKDRLKELEDEIETFRKENANLTRMREEIDSERQKFYEEKSKLEQKFNEEKILSEYYLAEEKEKLCKQKQIYERYVRDMRGRLNKKEKDDITNLKKEIHDLKEEIKLKDSKSTSTIARLRNQLKLMEKDKKNLEEEIEKLKKENRRIQHSNEMTRRLTNIKYLEQINKKLTNIALRDSRSEVELDSNIKYKVLELEQQSRGRKFQELTKGKIKPRAKSVPNLRVTSRYAKYFSQKDSLSEKENNNMSDNIKYNICKKSNEKNNVFDDPEICYSDSGSEDENKLEKIYHERFRSLSPALSIKSVGPYSENIDKHPNKSSSSDNDFFIQKPDNCSQKSRSFVTTDINFFSKSPPPFRNRLSNGSKSPLSITSEEIIPSYHHNINNRTKSPTSVISNRSSSSLKSGTVITKEKYFETLIPSPEPQSSKTSLSKTKLSPTEIIKPDGSKELRFPNGNIKMISADGKYSKFIYYNGDIKENFYGEGRIKYYYAETKTYHTTHPDGLEVLEFPDGQVEKRYKDGSSEIRLPNGSLRYYDPKNEHVREEWRFPDGAALTVAANGEQRIVFANGQVEVHAKDHKRREYPDGTVKLVYNDGTSETRYVSGRVRIKDKHGNLIMDSSSG